LLFELLDIHRSFLIMWRRIFRNDVERETDKEIWWSSDNYNHSFLVQWCQL